MDLSNKRNRIIFFFITWVGGMFGIHWFVQRNYMKGCLYLFTCGGFVVCWFYDLVIALVNIFSYKQERFPKQEKHLQVDNNNNKITKDTTTYDQKQKELAIQARIKHMESFNRILNDVQCGFKKLDPYLSRYRILLEIYDDIEKITIDYKLDPLPFTLNQLHSIFSDELNDFIKNKVIVTLDIHSIDQDENKALKKDLMKIRKEIIEGKHSYPEFFKLLESVQFQIENEMNKL